MATRWFFKGFFAVILLGFVVQLWADTPSSSEAKTRIGVPAITEQLKFESNSIVFVQTAASAVFDEVGEGANKYTILRMGKVAPRLSFLGGDAPQDVGLITIAKYLAYWTKWPNNTVNAILVHRPMSFFKLDDYTSFFLKVSAPVFDKDDGSLIYRIESASGTLLSSGVHKDVFLIIELPKTTK